MMRKYISKRLFHTLITFLGAVLFMLFIYLSMPSNYASTLILTLSNAERIALEHALHLDQPKIVQFGLWAKNILSGNLGYSFSLKQPVWDVVRPAFISSFTMFFLAMFTAILIAVPISIICAKNHNTKKDYIWSMVAFVGISIPPFVLVAILTKLFTFNMVVFNLKIFKTVSFTNYSNTMNHFILPFVVLTFYNITIFLRYLRSSILEIQKSEFVYTARAKGLTEKKVYYKHILHNAMIPVLTVLSGNIPSMVSTLIMIEYVLKYNGLASVMMDSVHSRDYPLSLAFTIILAVTILVFNFIIDILYAVFDPRIKLDR